MTRRRLVCLAFAALFLALLGSSYTIYWRYVAGELSAGISAWAENERAVGRIAEFSAGEIEGFPFAFRRIFTAVELGQPVADGVLRVTASRLAATMRPWNLQVIEVTSDAPVTADLLSHAEGETRISLGEGAAEIRLLADGRPQRLELVGLEAVLVSKGRSYTAKGIDLALDLPALTPQSHRDPFLDFDLALDTLTLPEGERALTAAPIARAAAAGTIKGPIVLAQEPRTALAQWALGGGTVELLHFAFAQAPLDLEGEGTLALDRDLQLLGALTLRAQGLVETIDLLVADGMIPEGTARTGRMMAEGLTKKDDKGRRVAKIAISLQQGFAWLGPIRLAPLPVLTW